MEPNYVYGDAEREIVKSGYEAIEAVLVGNDNCKTTTVVLS